MTLQRILYVEDEPDIREIGTLALAAVGGFDVCVCVDGTEALAKAAEFPAQLLILDVMMPGLDGPATLAALRALPAYADVPAVFMTAKVQPQEVKAFLALGALAVIAKPFDPMGLANTLRETYAAHQDAA